MRALFIIIIGLASVSLYSFIAEDTNNTSNTTTNNTAAITSINQITFDDTKPTVMVTNPVRANAASTSIEKETITTAIDEIAPTKETLPVVEKAATTIKEAAVIVKTPTPTVATKTIQKNTAPKPTYNPADIIITDNGRYVIVNGQFVNLDETDVIAEQPVTTTTVKTSATIAAKPIVTSKPKPIAKVSTTPTSNTSIAEKMKSMDVSSEMPDMDIVASTEEEVYIPAATPKVNIKTSNTTTVEEEAQEENMCGMQNEYFQVGEKLTYKLYYNWTAIWMSAGKVTFDLKEGNVGGEEVLHVVTEGKTAKSFDWFFKVRDRYETFINPQTMLPVQFIRNVHEGDYTKNNMFTFDHANNQAEINYIKRMGNTKRENETIEIPSCTQDLLSAIYYVRCIDYENLNPGDKVPVDVIIDGEMYQVYVRYIGKDVLKHNKKKYNCVKFSPLMLEGDVFKGGEDMILWATDDDNRLPLMIESPLTVGSVKAYLHDFEGLMHSQTSRVK